MVVDDRNAEMFLFIIICKSMVVGIKRRDRSDEIYSTSFHILFSFSQIDLCDRDNGRIIVGSKYSRLGIFTYSSNHFSRRYNPPLCLDTTRFAEEGRASSSAR